MTTETAAAQHTPGPWAVEDNPWGGTPHVRTDRRRLLRMLAENNQQIAEAEANARLIAAAPDLLAALEAVTAAVDADYTCGLCGEEGEHAPICLVYVLRAAIRKARL